MPPVYNGRSITQYKNEASKKFKDSPPSQLILFTLPLSNPSTSSILKSIGIQGRSKSRWSDTSFRSVCTGCIPPIEFEEALTLTNVA